MTWTLFGRNVPGYAIPVVLASALQEARRSPGSGCRADIVANLLGDRRDVRRHASEPARSSGSLAHHLDDMTRAAEFPGLPSVGAGADPGERANTASHNLENWLLQAVDLHAALLAGPDITDEDVYTVSHNRESWLLRAIDCFRPTFEAAGAPLPEIIRVSSGLPASGHDVAGEYHHARERTGEDLHYIFLSPLMDSTIEVLDVLVHELCHAAIPTAGHGPAFARLARSLGLEGPSRDAAAGSQLIARLRGMERDLGRYPHRRFDPTANHEPLPARMVKVECPDCSYPLYTTEEWLGVGVPTCPYDGIEMWVEDQ